LSPSVLVEIGGQVVVTEGQMLGNIYETGR